MAKFVIAGKANCPFYARAEHIGDELMLRLPDFSIHKIVLIPEDWDSWVEKQFVENGWELNLKVSNSPIIWRELVNRGGKAVFIGGCDEFLEISKIYYGVECTKFTSELISIACENAEAQLASKKLLQEENKKLSAIPLLKLVILFSSSMKDFVSGLILKLLSSPFDTDKKMDLVICSEDIELNESLLMELQDCMFPSLHCVKAEADFNTGLLNSDYIIIFSPDKLEKIELNILKDYAIALNSSVKNTTKILIAGNTAMQTCFVISHFADKVSKSNIYALSRYEENKIKSAVGKQIGVSSSNVKDVFLWGYEHQFIVDLTNAKVNGYDGAIWAPHLQDFTYSVEKIIYKKKWCEETATNILSESQKVGALSFSAALASQIKDIINPMCKKTFSLGIVSEGFYGIPENLVFSVPIFYNKGRITAIENLERSKNLEMNIQSSAIIFKNYCDSLIITANA